LNKKKKKYKGKKLFLRNDFEINRTSIKSTSVYGVSYGTYWLNRLLQIHPDRVDIADSPIRFCRMGF
jgi:hypothetical protein